MYIIVICISWKYICYFYKYYFVNVYYSIGIMHSKLL